MDFLFDFFALFSEAITSAIDFLVSFVMDIVYIIQVIGSVLAQIPSFFSWMPTELSTIIVVDIGIAAVFRIAVK